MSAIVGALLLLGLVAAWVWTRSPGRPGTTATKGPRSAEATPVATITIDVAGSPGLQHPAAQRLADEAAARIFNPSPQVREVRVVTRDGGQLGHYVQGSQPTLHFVEGAALGSEQTLATREAQRR